MSFSEFEKSLPQYDLWEYLKNTDKSIVMYGMGNGADKIICELDKIGVTVADFFASDGFVRGQCFHEKKVLSFGEIKEKYNDFIILVSFGSEREEVVNFIEKMSLEYELYLPDVPVAGEGLFNLDFYHENREKIKKAYELFADKKSKKCFENIILYKLTGKIGYLLCENESDEEIYANILNTTNYKIAADLGAYNGDSTVFISANSTNLEKIIAIEPDRKNYAKILRNTENIKVVVEAHNLCAWSERTALSFDRGGNRNSSVSGIGHTPSIGDTKKEIVTGDALDNIAGSNKIDFIKIDVEGAEAEAIKGCNKIMSRYAPEMHISAYHRNGDIFELTILINSLLPDHKLYLRHKRCLPAWEISLLAVK